MIACSFCVLSIDQGLATEAPTGNGNNTNGFLSQSDYNAAIATFNKVETGATGLGPVFNDDACGKCHRAPVAGGSGNSRAHRVGFFDGVEFIEPPGGSLIDTRALSRRIIPVVPANANVDSFRTSLSTLGDGYVEAVPDSTLIAIANLQPGLSGGIINGHVNRVPVLESPGILAVGRFGWKAQHASLVSFSADAYRNEMGITTPLFPDELTSNGNPVDAFEPPGFFSTIANRPDNSEVYKVSNLMRSSPARPRSAGAPPLIISPSTRLNANATRIRAGQLIFQNIGCGICHVDSMTTAPAGTPFFNGAYTVPAALGNLTFHPFGDFLLHDVGTGDGIVQNGGQITRNKMRTAPLWGLGRRRAFLHDDSVTSLSEAILRHAGESTQVTQNYRNLTVRDQQNVLLFLQSL